MSQDSKDRSGKGRVFHKLGEFTWKAWSPWVSRDSQ